MRISIGSRSIPKISAITRAFSKYPELWVNDYDKIEYIIIPKETRTEGELSGFEKDKLSGVRTNPMSFEEIIKGAKTRAKYAFEYGEETRYVHIWSWNRSGNV